MVKKYGELFLRARRELKETEGENAANAARALLSYASGKSTAVLIADRELYASEEIEQKLDELVARMLRGEPLAYVLGCWDFCGLTLEVTPDVLIPRDDTMAVTELAIEACRTMPAPQRVLDLCTGSGCIGLAVAHAVESARITLADVSAAALAVAKRNIASFHMSGRVMAFEVNALLPPPKFIGQFDLIVSNPPYVTKEEMTELPSSVRDFEPALALDGGEDGLDFYRAICGQFAAALKPGGQLCLEFGFGQQLAVGQIMAENGFYDLHFQKDWRGVTRAVSGKKRKIIKQTFDI